jgi:ribosomal-protein-alanine N-acetyltransferase
LTQSAFPVLEAERLLLRELRHGDAPTLLEIHGDAQVMRWMGNEALTDLDAAHHTVSRFLAGRVAIVPSFRWGLERKSDRQLLGTGGVFNWAKEWKKSTLGYELGIAAQGHGYMHEALNSILPWVFENLELHRLEALIHPDNLAAFKLAQKLGFQIEGTLREVTFWNDAHHDMVQLGLLRRDFSPSGTIFQS